MRVWILGAGFSAPLGGPTLNQLLSRTGLDRLQHAFPQSWLHEPACGTCVELLTRGEKEGLWKNAEEYVAALISYDSKLFADIVRLNGGHPDYDDEYLQQDPTERFAISLYCTAIALIAAQCIHFVKRAADNLEAWMPYDRWVRRVPDQDVFITFNYDEVVETAFARNKRSLLVPDQRYNHGLPVTPGEQVLLKLHGGVGVRDTIVSPPEPNGIENLLRNPAMISVPGTSKADEAETSLDQLWDAASEALASADKVSIVGYRCPPSDEKAKAMLIDSLHRNPNKPAVDIVLGHANPDAHRLVALLRSIGLEARDAGLGTEDYLSSQGVGAGWMTLDCRS